MSDLWHAWGTRILSARVARSATPAVELLVAGAVLGPATMLDLIREHHDHIDARLESLGDVLVPGLARISDDSGALLLRLLGRHADSGAVDALQAALIAGLQEYALLRAEEAEPAAIDHLFEALVTSDGGRGHDQP